MDVFNIIGHLDLGIDRHIFTHIQELFYDSGTQQSMVFVSGVGLNNNVFVSLVVVYITIFGLEYSFSYKKIC